MNSVYVVHIFSGQLIYGSIDFVAQQRMAQEVLTTLKEHPDAWTRVDTILEYSQSLQTKYYALQILENVIKTRWKVLPRAQCEGSQLSVSLSSAFMPTILQKMLFQIEDNC